ncbi:MAG: 50S ribosomal protein L35 [Candidatus Eisenbacteria bacterium]|nr:50S ribosomal protein L35 [Candidatus Eisenbacteria bacterium]
MPKVKTHRGAAKRFKRTGAGKIKRPKAYTGHFFIRKSARAKRNLRKQGYVHKADQPRIERLLRD